MSLSSRTSDALIRIGAECKSIRTAVSAKYTKPGSGIPLSDLSSGVQANLAPLAPPGIPDSGLLGGVKNPYGEMVADAALPSYQASTIGINADGEMSSFLIQGLYKAFTIFLSGQDPDGEAVADGQLVGTLGLTNDVKKMLKASLRWEQEVLVQSGTRVTGTGTAALGIHVPYGVRVKGIKYEFESATTLNSTLGGFNVNNIAQTAGAMNVAQNQTVQTINGIDIAVPAGSRIRLNVSSIGSGFIGKGIYMSMWGEYDLSGVTLP